MTQIEIEIFLAVVDKRNLSKAASALFMSQSTLSHRLTMLEKELNTPLFIRHKGQRTVELTPYGHSFIHIAERWLALWSEAQELHTMNGTRSLYIGAVASLLQYLFPDVICRMFQERPNVRLMCKYMQSAALYPALENGEINLGFSVRPSVYSNVVNKPLLSEESVLLVCCDHLTPVGTFGPDVHPKDLDPRKEILFHYHQDYLHWRHRWYGHFASPAIGAGEALLVERFFEQPIDNWCAVPMSMALSVQRTHQVSLHHFVSPPPPRICYMLTHRILGSGYESCLQIFQDYLDRFLQQEEAAGHLQILT